MLILSRRVNEAITVTHPDGTEVVISVLGVLGGQVRLGFDAPKEVRILRDNAVDRDDPRDEVVRSTL